MGPKTKQLVKVLEQIISLLESDGEKHWKKWISESKLRLLKSDYSGIEYLLRAYGGMGSFNDLVIYQDIINGKIIFKQGFEKKNDTLSKLRSKAWHLATYIKRNHEINITEQASAPNAKSRGPEKKL